MSGRAAAALKVPLWRALAEAFRQVLGDLKSVARIGWLPFLVLLCLGTTMRLFPVNDITGAIDPQVVLPVILLEFVALVVQTLCYNSLMVGWYRHVLRRAGNSATVGGYWSAFWRVLGYYVLLLVGLIVFVAVAMLLVGTVLIVFETTRRVAAPSQQSIRAAILLGAGIGAIVFSLIFTRACLVFPASACGHSLGLRSAWRKLRGNTWRLIAAIFVLTVAYVAIASIPTLTYNPEAFSSIISGARPKIALLPIPLSIAIELFDQMMLFISLTLSSSVAGIFYRELVLRPADVAEVFA